MSDEETAPPQTPLADGPWRLKTRSIGRSAAKGSIEACEADRAALARSLGLIACDRLKVDYRLKPIGKDRFQASGRIEADVVQACVVTLEPVPEEIREEFSVAFWPAEDVGEDVPEGEIVLDADLPEPIEHGEIALGRLVYELISVALDPFPRSPGADAAEAELLRDQPKPDNPFAALKSLKKPT